MTIGTTFEPILNPKITLGGNVSAGQLVNFSGTVCTAGQASIGVAIYGGTTSDVIPITAVGAGQAICGEAVTVGEALQSNATGKVVAWTPGGVFVGRALTATTNPNDTLTIEVAGNSPALAPKAWINLEVATLVGTGVSYVIAPEAGKVTKIWSIIDAALGTGDATLTAAIGATPITTGVITITQAGSAAGDVDSCVPTAANTVAAGDKLNLTVGGTNSVSTMARVIMEITLT
jgi:hypothetical protein